AADEADARADEEAAARSGEHDGDGDEKQSQATALVKLAHEAGAEFWHTPGGDAFATVPVNEHHEHHRIVGKAFRSWLARRFYLQCGRAPNSQAKQDAI